MNDTKGLVSEIEAYLKRNAIRFADGSPILPHALLERALTALKAQDWQPIESAPIGIRVLIFDPLVGNQAVAIRHTGGGWKTHLNTPNNAWSPTHWQPLPQPPKEPNNKEEA